MKIGAHQLRNSLFVAPMAGITDRPFRRIARRMGAGLAVSEMISSRPELRESRKTRLRQDHAGEAGPISVQIAGGEPAMLAEAARYNAGLGADIDHAVRNGRRGFDRLAGFVGPQHAQLVGYRRCGRPEKGSAAPELRPAVGRRRHWRCLGRKRRGCEKTDGERRTAQGRGEIAEEHRRGFRRQLARIPTS